MIIGKYILYRNLHSGAFSICRRIEGKRGHRKWKDVSSILIKNAKFRIWNGLQQKVRDTGHKNVHAFVHFGEDFWIDPQVNLKAYRGEIPIHYNPFETDTFIIEGTDIPVHEAGLIYGRNNKLYILEE